MHQGRRRIGLLGFVFMTMAMFLAIRPAFAVPVTTELLLLVDVSGSIDSNEFNLQRTGYVNAFQNASVQNMIALNPGGIAVSLVYWSNFNQQSQAVGWTHLTDAASANAFAAAIGSASRPYNNSTAVQSALSYGGSRFANNGFDGVKLIIDISGDGVDNNSPVASNFRNGGGRANALAAGVDTINGLVIGGDAAVTNYYNQYVLGGVGEDAGTLFAASTFADFGNAVLQKIFYEVSGGCEGNCPELPCLVECPEPPCIDDCGTSSTSGSSTSGSSTSGSSTGGGDPQPVPEPATLLLVGSGLSGLAMFFRRRRLAGDCNRKS